MYTCVLIILVATLAAIAIVVVSDAATDLGAQVQKAFRHGVPRFKRGRIRRLKAFQTNCRKV